jgi:hypothetical protein
VTSLAVAAFTLVHALFVDKGPRAGRVRRVTTPATYADVSKNQRLRRRAADVVSGVSDVLGRSVPVSTTGPSVDGDSTGGRRTDRGSATPGVSGAGRRAWDQAACRAGASMADVADETASGGVEAGERGMTDSGERGRRCATPSVSNAGVG